MHPVMNCPSTTEPYLIFNLLLLLCNKPVRCLQGFTTAAHGLYSSNFLHALNILLSHTHLWRCRRT